MPSVPRPRLVIAAIRGGGGKTVLSLGLVRAFRKKGLRVVPFKKGPDYIDAAWLAAAAGVPCCNLDPYLMTPDGIRDSFAFRSGGADLTLIEGNRGLFDGRDVKGASSTAELAKLLAAPVVLVVDCTKMTRTVAALVLGCMQLDPETQIQAVILNQIATDRHERVVRQAVEENTGLPVLGAVRRMKADPIPMRHLGLIPRDEYPGAMEQLDRLAGVITDSVDLQALRAIMTRHQGWAFGEPDAWPSGIRRQYSLSTVPRIGVIRDGAFQFYYPENLEALEAAGAELTFIDALRDGRLPDIDGLYIGGGFPETQSSGLSANRSLRKEILQAIESGLPVYAECGGLMYLGRQIVWKGSRYSMVGAIGWDFVLSGKPAGHGYSELEVRSENPFFPKGTRLKGHEFHYSRPIQVDGKAAGLLTCRVIRGFGFDGAMDGIVRCNLFGTYTHIHAVERPEWAVGIVRAAEKHRLMKSAPAPPDPGADSVVSAVKN